MASGRAGSESAPAPAGVAYCWGNDSSGQLGDGTICTNPGCAQARITPVAVLGGLTFVAVSAGAYHTCGLTPGGAAYCWGANYSGQLGDGTTADRGLPVKVALQQ